MTHDDGDPYYIPTNELRDRPECILRRDEQTWGKALNDGLWLGFIIAVGLIALTVVGSRLP